MDNFTPMGAAGNPVDPFKSMSSIMGIARQGVALQQQKQELQQQQVAIQEAQGLNQFFSEWKPGDHVAADGTTDLDAAHASDAYQKIPGVARAAVDQKLIAIKQGQIQNSSSLLGLTRDQLGMGSQLLGSLAQDPDVISASENGKAKVQAGLNQWGQLGGPAGAKVAQTYAGITNGKLEPGDPKDPNKPGDLVQRIRALQKAALTADRQLQITQPGGGSVQAQGGVQQVQANPYAQGAVGAPLGQSTPNVAGPAVVTFSSGQVGAMGPGGTNPRVAGGAAAGAAGGAAGGGGRPVPAGPPGRPSSPFFKPDGSPRTAHDDAPGPNAPRSEQEAYQASVGQAREYVNNVRGADEPYGTNVAISEAIRRLAKNTTTGPGTPIWQHAMGALGAPAGFQNVADYQTLAAMLDRQAATLRQTMGLPTTNEGQATAQQISGNTEYQRQAILAKNDFNQSLVEGIHQFRKGLDRVEGFTGTPSPKSVQAFRSAWTDNFDPTIYELENAKKRMHEDPQAIASVVNRIPAGQRSDLADKRKKLQLLSNGQAPGE